MKKTRLIGMLVLILFMGNSCKTYKNLETVKPKTDSDSMVEELQKLKPRDKIKVFEKSGRSRNLKYVVTEKGLLRGLGTRGTNEDLISIKIEDIEKIKVKATNVYLFSLGTLAALWGVYVIILAITDGYK